MPMSRLVAPLFEGHLDVVGDVHGEWDVLQSLVRNLGYDREGRHPEGRHLVFVGDLGDRGHDSPAVVGWVKGLVDAGRAQCVLGNHELNLLRGASKDGNRWYLEPDHPEHQGPYRHSKVATEAQRQEFLGFFASLPLALERDDLRVVHAAWNREAVDKVRGLGEPSLDAFVRYEHELSEYLKSSGLETAARAEEEQYRGRFEREAVPMPLLPNLAKFEELKQMFNPVRVLTSGQERVAKEPFFASEKWRMCERVPWWEEYDEPAAVIVGHYWRNAGGERERDLGRAKSDPFEGIDANAWVGHRRNVFCVDYSIGARHDERRRGAQRFHTRLAALRWPERTLTFEDGESRPTV